MNPRRRGGRWRHRLNSGECLRRHHFCSSQGQVAPQAQLEESANDRDVHVLQDLTEIVQDLKKITEIGPLRRSNCSWIPLFDMFFLEIAFATVSR